MKVAKIQIRWYFDAFFHHEFDKTVAVDSLIRKHDLFLELDHDVFSEDKVDFVVKQALLNQVAVEIICFSASVVHVQL